MPQNQLPPDDPRLTAYALEELDPTEQESLERLLADSPQAQAAVREIRELAGLLTTELRQEPVVGLTAQQRMAILVAGQPIAEAAHGPANNDPPVSLSSRSSNPPASSTWASNRSVKRFASLVTIAALIVVVAVMIPPTRPQVDLPIILAENGREVGESQRLGLQFEFAGEAGDGARPDVTKQIPMLSSAEPSMNNGTAGSAKFGENIRDQDGLPAIVTGETTRLSAQSSAAARDYSMPTGLGRGLAPSAGKPNVTLAEPDQSGKQTTTYHFAAEPKGVAERLGQGGNGSGGGRNSGENRAIATSKFGTDGRGAALRLADGEVRTGPAAPGGPMGNARAAVQFSTGGSGKTSGSGKLAQPAEELSDNIENERKPDSSRLAHRKSEVEDLTNSRFAKPNQLYRKNLGEQKTDLYAEQRNESEVDANALGVADGESRKYHRLDQLHDLTERGRMKFQRHLDLGTEVYEPIVENLFFSAYEDPLSTFGVDVDTASYANVRRFLTDHQLPPPNAVRIEELVNYFSYDYPQPAAGQPFSVNVEAANCPWNPGHQLVRIGLKGKEISRDQRPASNLVFLVDVSGSMQAENKLPLVKLGLNLLTQQMTESDRVAIVTYSDSAVQRLESTNGTNKQQIVQVIDSLQASGSTNGAAGIQLAYRAAIDHFIDGGANRVILCTDGDFNVGVTGDDELVQLIQERARTKVFFSVFGFGMGNLKDGKLEKLADKGNGHYAYIDGQRETHKLFVDELVGTLVTIAKDVKLQVEFNPKQVGAYRLIGYENRVMASQDFNNDKKDAGDVGAGHTVTALYEIVPAGESPKPELGDALRYRKAVVPQEGEVARELLTVKLRYKLPEADVSTLLEFPAAAVGGRDAGLVGKADGVSPSASRDFNWAAAVAAFGMILRDSQFRGQANFDMVLELAQGAKGEDKAGHREEFIELVKTAKALCLPASPPASTTVPPATLTREQAEAKAGVNGKYRNLLRIVPAAGDAASYGSFHEFGRWEGTSYLGQNNLPEGYWVYVAPDWYIWGDAR